MSSAVDAAHWLPPRKRHKRETITKPTNIPTVGLQSAVEAMPRGSELRFTSQHTQQLLEENAELLAQWVRIKETTRATAEVPPALQRNLSILSAAALHDGADEFFPMRPGNVEVGGRGIPEPPRRVPGHWRQSSGDGVSHGELAILSDLQHGKYATGKQFRDAVAVALQRLVQINDGGGLTRVQKHVRDILLRVLAVDLTVPRTHKGVMGLLSALITDLRSGPLSVDKYRKRLGRLPSKGNPQLPLVPVAAAEQAMSAQSSSPPDPIASAPSVSPADDAGAATLGERKKWPFIMNTNGVSELLVKVWIPENMAHALESK
jgi:hypothetical protein